MLSHYRLYLLDGGGRICNVVVLDCTDDADAIARSEAVAQHEPRELWDRSRLLKAWRAQGADSPGDRSGPLAAASF